MTTTKVTKLPTQSSIMALVCPKKINVIRAKSNEIQKVTKTKSKVLFVFLNVSPKTKSKSLN